MKIRITNLDYNLFKPINYFDDNLSSFSDLPLANSPILRVFGRLDTGQMACAHVHGVYPYFYIEYKHSVTPEKGTHRHLFFSPLISLSSPRLHTSIRIINQPIFIAEFTT